MTDSHAVIWWGEEGGSFGMVMLCLFFMALCSSNADARGNRRDVSRYAEKMLEEQWKNYEGHIERWRFPHAARRRRLSR